MERQQYLIDTNAVIDYLGEKFPATGMTFMSNVVDLVPIVSVITKIEVLGFGNAGEHYELLTNFMADAQVLDLTSNVVDESIEIRKHSKTKLPDAIIAATAIAHNLILISRNMPDFKKIKGLKLVDPHNL